MEGETRKNIYIFAIYLITITAVTTFNAVKIEEHYIFIIATVLGLALLIKTFKSLHETIKED